AFFQQLADLRTSRTLDVPPAAAAATAAHRTAAPAASPTPPALEAVAASSALTGGTIAALHSLLEACRAGRPAQLGAVRIARLFHARFFGTQLFRTKLADIRRIFAFDQHLALPEPV